MDVDTDGPPKADGITAATPPTAARIIAFSTFFKSYMSVGAVVTAALPIPVTMIGLIPTYEAQAGALSVYASLLCFLLLGLIFFFRHSLGRQFFALRTPKDAKHHSDGLRSVNALPAILIVLCALSIFGYQEVLRRSIWDTQRLKPAIAGTYAFMKSRDRLNAGDSSIASTDSIQAIHARELSAIGGPDLRTATDIIKTQELPDIFYGNTLALLYLGIFVFAEAAFILMALKEYLQDLLGIRDEDLIRQQV